MCKAYISLLTFIQFSYVPFNFLHAFINVIKWSQPDITLYVSPWWYLIDTIITSLVRMRKMQKQGVQQQWVRYLAHTYVFNHVYKFTQQLYDIFKLKIIHTYVIYHQVPKPFKIIDFLMLEYTVVVWDLHQRYRMVTTSNRYVHRYMNITGIFVRSFWEAFASIDEVSSIRQGAYK